MQTYRGFKISVRRTRDRYGDRHNEVRIDGHFQWAYNAGFPGIGLDRDKAVRQAQYYIDDSLDVAPDGYTWTRELTPAQLKRRQAMPAAYA